MEISTSNWNGKGVRANPHTRKIAPATITAMRLISSFVIRAIAKVPKPTASKTKPVINFLMCATVPYYCELSQWYEAIADLIPNLPSSKLPASKKPALEKQLRHFPHVKALLIQHTGGHQIKNPDEPCWTITRSVFTDHKGNNRSNFADVWLPDGTVKALNLEAIARLQGFPSWYVFPEHMSIAGSIVGYSVPPLMMPKLLHRRN